MIVIHCEMKPSPILGSVSVLLPCIGGGLFFVIARAALRSGSEANLFGAYGLWTASMMFGILSAAIAWMRQERCRLLPLFGLLLSLGPLVFGVALLVLQ
jgi:hypothetical protein